jgi:SAM-dependent methyltransferase
VSQANYFLEDNPAEVELVRLRLLERLAHKWTVEAFGSVGDLTGKRCLELGAGGGGVARWLADLAGPTGSVTAVDKDVQFLTDLPSNVDVIEADLTTFEPDGDFDIVHSRAVLAYVPERDRVLKTVAQHLAPGGRLICEEVLFLMNAEFTSKMRGSVDPDDGVFGRLFDLGSMDVTRFPSQLPVTFADLGLADIEARVNADVIVGGDDGWAQFLIMTVADVAAPMAVAFGLASDGLPDRMRTTFSDPAGAIFSPAFVATRGRRP